MIARESLVKTGLVLSTRLRIEVFNFALRSDFKNPRATQTSIVFGISDALNQTEKRLRVNIIAKQEVIG